METKLYDIREWNEATFDKLSEAAEILKNGGLVAFPTETVYGLGANALDPDAVASIYKAKGRPSDNPLIVHVADTVQCRAVTDDWPETADKLAKAFWPGPLTMVLPKKENVPSVTTGGLSTVAIRMPDHPAALELIRRAGCPIAAPSANLSGRPSPTKGSHVVQDMNGRIPMILIGDDCRVGIESTVLDLSGEAPTILRPGILTPEQLQKVIGIPVKFDHALFSKKPWEDAAETENGKKQPAPKSPGMKYRHYAPKAEMIILKGEGAALEKSLLRLKAEREAKGQTVGVICFDAKAFEQAAHDFFANLRELDDKGVDLILATAMNDENSVGFAIMNRMLKSASYKVIEV